ncbi:PIN domain-containing protein [Mycobacterium sp. E735]|uniref:PIN domain-containing protein n=1 Tax=Mycobacterium sp. E735 TaxID=1834148 RepID=UPI0008016B14|nr:PIN domain-containing protein [Mycobacterium sp. E735]OBG50191.1 hypothetical protein A5704_06035 [Mycobacterium sp. E735]
MAVIVLDTNILVASPLLDSREWSSLTEHAADWGIEILVPDVVLMETVNVVRRAWTSMRQKLDDLALGGFGLEDAKSAILVEVGKRSVAYEEWLRSRLDEMGVKVSPTPLIDHLEIARRASEGRAPYCGKDKDGYRDTLVWYSVLTTAQENPDTEIWFVSDNHTDFGPKPPNWTGEGSGQRESCPILFHTDLTAELAEYDLDRRVFYVVSLARIEQHFASQFAPIDASDLQRLIDTMDKDAQAQKLVDAVAGFKLDPEEAALPLDAEAAEIIGAREQVDGWVFTEAARRGDAGWTARFAVDTEVDIALVGTGMVASEHTKVLRLLGQVWISSDGQILDIAVDCAEALTDDPMRNRWQRRAARSPLGDTELSNILELLKFQQENQSKLVRDALPTFTALADMLKTEEEKRAKLIREAIPTFTGLGDMLRGQQNEWAKSIREATQLSGLADILKTQQEKQAQMIRDVMPGLSGIADVLKDQQAQWAKMIRDSTPNFTGLAEALKIQQDQWAKTIREATSGFTGIGAILKRQQEPAPITDGVADADTGTDADTDTDHQP